MKTRINIATCNGYILSNGKLTAYEYKSAKVDFATGEVEYDCILGGVPTTFKTTDIIKVYKDEDAFKRDQVFNDYTYSWGEFIRSTIGYAPYELDDDEDCAKAYCVKNGEVVETAFPTIFIMEKGKQSRYVGDRVYTSRKEAMLYCDIVKVEADGTEVSCPSPASLVALNEEQKKAVQAVEEALARASELGVEFGHDITDDEMFAYSNTHLLDTDWGYDGELITAFGYCINDLVTPLKSRPFLSYSRCESQFLVKFK
jgi:hypothetical protein